MRLFNKLDKTQESGNVNDASEELQEAIEKGRVEIDFPYPDILIIEGDNKRVFLKRYTSTRKFGGDTWHQNIEDAKQQARDEYGKRVGEWQEIPEEVNDPLEYISSQFKKN
jgi:hypothetical protein